MTREQLQSLIVKYANGSASEEETRQLMDWYRNQPVGDVQWNEGSPETVRARMLNRLQGSIKHQKPTIVSISLFRAAAAILLFATAVAVTYFFVYKNTPEYISINNPAGKILMVTLPDSSIVWLNASSSLRYNKSFTNNRDLHLQGEAFFNVKHDPYHPFLVKAGGIRTTVLGTSFNIKAYNNDSTTKVSVMSGKVKTEDGKGVDKQLTKNMELTFIRNNARATVSTFDTTKLLAWQKGELRFSGQSLRDIAASLERWYGVKIRFSNTAITDCRYYMSFKNTTSLREVLTVMQEVSNIKSDFESSQNLITLSGDGCN